MKDIVPTTDWHWINLARSFIVTASQAAPRDLLKLKSIDQQYFLTKQYIKELSILSHLPFCKKTKGMSLLSQSWTK